jgi:hypothetical protein
VLLLTVLVRADTEDSVVLWLSVDLATGKPLTGLIGSVTCGVFVRSEVLVSILTLYALPDDPSKPDRV